MSSACASLSTKILKYAAIGKRIVEPQPVGAGARSGSLSFGKTSDVEEPSKWVPSCHCEWVDHEAAACTSCRHICSSNVFDHATHYRHRRDLHSHVKRLSRQEDLAHGGTCFCFRNGAGRQCIQKSQHFLSVHDDIGNRHIQGG